MRAVLDRGGVLDVVGGEDCGVERCSGRE